MKKTFILSIAFLCLCSCGNNFHGPIQVYNQYSDFLLMENDLEKSDNNRFSLNLSSFSALCDFNYSYYLFGFCDHDPYHNLVADYCPAIHVATPNIFLEKNNQYIMYTLLSSKQLLCNEITFKKAIASSDYKYKNIIPFSSRESLYEPNELGKLGYKSLADINDNKYEYYTNFCNHTLIIYNNEIEIGHLSFSISYPTNEMNAIINSLVNANKN